LLSTINAEEPKFGMVSLLGCPLSTYNIRYSLDLTLGLKGIYGNSFAVTASICIIHLNGMIGCRCGAISSIFSIRVLVNISLVVVFMDSYPRFTDVLQGISTANG
jgi:hypothetical protein